MTTAGGDAQPEDIALRPVVTRSKKRKRTVGWVQRGDEVHITVPSWMSRADEARWTADIMAKMRRKRAADRVNLRTRATDLARTYDLPRAREIKWADDMATRWGSCTPHTATVRISSRMAAFPTWVIDYVIVHELAHIAEANHSPAFWRLVRRYPKTERAVGYLIAKSGEPDHDDPNQDDPDQNEPDQNEPDQDDLDQIEPDQGETNQDEPDTANETHGESSERCGGMRNDIGPADQPSREPVEPRPLTLFN